MRFSIVKRIAAGLAVALFVAAEIFAPSRGWSAVLRDGSGQELARMKSVQPPSGASVAWPAGAHSVEFHGRLRLERSGTWLFALDAPEGGLELEGVELLPVESGPMQVSYAELARGLYDVRIEHALDPTGAPTLRAAHETLELSPLSPGACLAPGTGALRVALPLGMRALAVALALFFLGALLPPRGRRVAVGLLLGFAAPVVLGELGLRLLRVQPRTRVPLAVAFEYEDFRPGVVVNYRGTVVGAPQEYAHEVRINRAGWREREYSPDKPPGTRRLLVLGDSYAEGKEVRFERTFHELLEARAEGWEVIALARGGTGTRAQLGFLREQGLALAPDRVLLAFFPGNDVCDNWPPLAQQRRAWRERVQRDVLASARRAFLDSRFLPEASRLASVLADRLCEPYLARLHHFRDDLSRADRTSPQEGLFDDPLKPEWEAAWDATGKLLLEIARISEGIGAPLAVLMVPSRVPGSRLDELRAEALQAPYERLRAICEELGIEVLDPRAAFAECAAQGIPTRFPIDGHWNERGHAIAAETVEPWLLR